jgi:hypothetical protein
MRRDQTARCHGSRPHVRWHRPSLGRSHLGWRGRSPMAYEDTEAPAAMGLSRLNVTRSRAAEETSYHSFPAVGARLGDIGGQYGPPPY